MYVLLLLCSVWLIMPLFTLTSCAKKKRSRPAAAVARKPSKTETRTRSESAEKHNRKRRSKSSNNKKTAQKATRSRHSHHHEHKDSHGSPSHTHQHRNDSTESFDDEGESPPGRQQRHKFSSSAQLRHKQKMQNKLSTGHKDTTPSNIKRLKQRSTQKETFDDTMDSSIREDDDVPASRQGQGQGQGRGRGGQKVTPKDVNDPRDLPRVDRMIHGANKDADDPQYDTLHNIVSEWSQSEYSQNQARMNTNSEDASPNLIEKERQRTLNVPHRPTPNDQNDTTTNSPQNNNQDKDQPNTP